MLHERMRIERERLAGRSSNGTLTGTVLVQARSRCAAARAQRGTGSSGRDAIKDAVKDLPGVKKSGSETDFDGEKFINDLKEKACLC